MMKLLSYHIENYGKIHGQDGNFAEGLTCFCERNGYGKSTMASFLKAMFYGLSSYTAATKTFPERKRYYPFSGGKFGGSILFEYEGKTYRIERFFDEKSAKGDTCRVYQNGSLYEGFGEDIGKTIFGVDEESFQKTVFITADEMEIFSTRSINEKLNGTAESGEENVLERALDSLEKAKKNLKAGRGSGGKINELKADIATCSTNIRNYKAMSDSLSDKYAERERRNAELAKLDDEVKKAEESGALLGKWENYDRLSLEAQEKGERIKGYERKYPLGIPSDEERSELSALWQKNERLRGSLKSFDLSLERKAEFAKLEEKFANGIPKDEVIDEVQGKIGKLTELDAERKALEKAADADGEREFDKRFANGIPTRAQLEQNHVTAEELKYKRKAFEERSADVLKSNAGQAKGRFNIGVYLLVFGCALLGAGAGLFFLEQALGLGLLIAGGVSLALGIVLKLVKPTMPPSNGENELLIMQAEIRDAEEKLLAFISGYGQAEGDAAYAFAALEEAVKAYREYARKEEERQRRAEQLRTQAEELRKECVAFLEGYGNQADNLQLGLNKLTAEIEGYRTSQRQNAEARQENARRQAEFEAGQAAMAKILQKYGLEGSVGTMDGLKELELAAETKESLLQEMEKLTRELAEYREKNNLTERPQEEKKNTDELRAARKECAKALVECDKSIQETERYVEKLSDEENLLATKEEQLQECKEKYDLLADTMSALKNAEQTLKDKYVAPIKDRFTAYAAALEEVLNEKVGMDKDFKVVFERGGETRSDKHLSAGERTLCALCLRLALIDNMYETEQPFIIMDDPFVHLDEEHVSRTRSLLRLLSKDKQILYFCCHESRRM